MNRITFLKILDVLAGKGIMALMPAARPSLPIVMDNATRALFIRPGGIGDFVLLLPAINALAHRFPGIRIDVLCEKRNAGVADLTRNIRTVYRYDHGVDIIRCLRNSYDVVIDTEQWYRLSAVVARFTGARVRVGFDTNDREKAFTHRIPYDKNEYEALSFSRLTEPLTYSHIDLSSSIPFVEAPDALPAHLSSRLDGLTVAIAPGASLKEKRFSTEKFGGIASELAGEGYTVVLLGSSSDKADAEKITRLSPGCLDLTGKTSLAEAASILKISRLLLTTDSALLHIAAGLGTPTVALFGCSNEKKWAPPSSGNIALKTGLECSPCSFFGYVPACANNIKCMDLIDMQDVLKAMSKVLLRHGS